MSKHLNALFLLLIFSHSVSADIAFPPPAELALYRQMNAIQNAPSLAEGEKLAASLILPTPNIWFSHQFGEELGVELTKEYNTLLQRAGGAQGIAKVIMKTGRKGQTNIRVEHVHGRTATGHQNRALALTKQPLDLYSVRFIQPGEKFGFHLWSFVQNGNAIRLVGKMKSLANAQTKPVKTTSPERQLTNLLASQMKAIQTAADLEAATTLTSKLNLPNPKAWFTQQFGEASTPKLVEGYEQGKRMNGGAKGYAKFIRTLGKKGQTEFIVKDVSETHPGAMKVSKKPLTLYSVRIVAPGNTTGGRRIQYFIYDGSAFRFVDMMRSLRQ